jgi:hypothetical protein
MSEAEKPDFSRRQLCGKLLTAAFGVSLVPICGDLWGATEQRVDENEAAAVSLGYRNDATQVDTKAFPKRAGAQGARQFCDNCALFEGEPGDRWAPCSIFQKRLVSGKGWCNAWVSRS